MLSGSDFQPLHQIKKKVSDPQKKSVSGKPVTEGSMDELRSSTQRFIDNMYRQYFQEVGYKTKDISWHLNFF